jgi:hypothetical protein
MLRRQLNQNKEVEWPKEGINDRLSILVAVDV